MPAEKIPGWIERLLMPKLSEISGDIKAINARIDALESNMNTK
jgi:outer membrane murein-binding lipoprotein Lpp